MQLLQDTFIIENLTVLNEGKGNKMRIKGVFGRCNEKNNNGRVYPTKVLEGQLSKVQPMISERRLCGELDHPSNDTVKLSNASHLITKLEMKGDELIGEAELLNTPAGLTAKALVEGGVKIGISSRGMGTLSEDADGNKIVNEDFRLVTFDLVADPSTRGAFPALSESTESRFVRETVGKLEKERTFLTMLESKMRDTYHEVIAEKSFPDLNKDGKITKADVLVGRGVIPGPKGKKKKMQAVKEEGSWHQIAYAIAEMFGMEVSEGVTDVMDKERERGSGVVKSNVAGALAARSVASDKVRQAKADVKADRIRKVGKIKNKGAASREMMRQTDPKKGRFGRAIDRLVAHTVYKQFGQAIAEGFGLVEMQDMASMSAAQKAERMKKMKRDSQRGKDSNLEKRRGMY